MTTIIGSESHSQWENPNTRIAVEPVSRVIKTTKPFLAKNPQVAMTKVAVKPPMPITAIITLPVPTPAPSACYVYTGNNRISGMNTPVRTKFTMVRRRITALPNI